MESLIETSFSIDRERILQVRHAVFVEEQGVPVHLEQDGKDPLCRHALLLGHERPLATGRLETDGHLGRIAVVRSHRGIGIGRRVLVFLEAMAQTAGLDRVYLGAQSKAIPFYEKLGYLPYGDAFMEAGIVHRQMRKVFGG